MLTGPGLIVRQYRPHWLLRAFAIGFLALASMGLINFSSNAISGNPHVTDILVPAFLTLFGLALSIHFFTTSVSLNGDVIAVQSLFRKRRLSLAEICGRREDESTDSEGHKTQIIVLEPCDRSLPDLKIERMYDFDLDFEVWLGQIPVLGE